MKPPAFRYVRPRTVDEALGLLDTDSCALAGGQSLIPQLNLRHQRPRRLVDLAAIKELTVVRRGAAGETILGAGVTLARIDRDPALRAAVPLLVEAIRLVGTPQIRARSTIGGNLAFRDPVSEVSAALTLLEAVVTIRSLAGERTAPVQSLELAAGELIVDVRIPPSAHGVGSSLLEVSPRYAARAFALAAASASVDESGRLLDAKIVVGGLYAAPTPLEGLSTLLGLRADDDRVGEAVEAAIGRIGDATEALIDDPRADAIYRCEAAFDLALRALREAARRAGGDRSARGVSAAIDSEFGTSMTARGSPAPAPGSMVPSAEIGAPTDIGLTVNDRRVHARVPPRLLLSDLLRGELGLHATHVGCEHGVCGACNVLLDGVAVRSCLLLAVQAEARHVQTLEGLRDREQLRELADAFVGGHALQCGFCTPGFMVTLAELRDQGSTIGADQLVGNLCRCTGYAPIMRVTEGF